MRRNKKGEKKRNLEDRDGKKTLDDTKSRGNTRKCEVKEEKEQKEKRKGKTKFVSKREKKVSGGVCLSTKRYKNNWKQERGVTIFTRSSKNSCHSKSKKKERHKNDWGQNQGTKPTFPEDPRTRGKKKKTVENDWEQNQRTKTTFLKIQSHSEARKRKENH